VRNFDDTENFSIVPSISSVQDLPRRKLVSIEISNQIPTGKVWDVLCQKLKRPHDYFPVKDVVARTSTDGKGMFY